MVRPSEEKTLDLINEALAALLRGGERVAVEIEPHAADAVEYRHAITSPDVATITGTPQCALVSGAGSVSNGTYYIGMVGVNKYGRTLAIMGDATVTTELNKNIISATMGPSPNVDAFDIYCTTASNPLWVGRVTEAQRLAGCIISAVGTVIAGSAPGVILIKAIGTGLACNTTAAVNTAYVMPTVEIDASGHQYIDLLVKCTRTGDAVAPVLSLAIGEYNAVSDQFNLSAPAAHTFGGVSGAYNPTAFMVRLEVRGISRGVVIATLLAGTGMSVDLDYVLS